MNILILTFGSRGDVQPYVALGKGLQSVGHAVTICTSSQFESFIVEHGLNYGYMTNELLKLMDSEAGRDAMENTTNIWEWVKTVRKLYQQVAPLQRQMLQDSWQVTQSLQPDLILYHPKAFGAPHFAEKLNIPVMTAVLQPTYVPTAEFPGAGFPNWKLGGWYNRLSYSLILGITKASIGKFVKEWRATHELPPLSRGIDVLHTQDGKAIPVLHGHSPHVVPTPKDWPNTAVATGYWFLDRIDTWQPPRELQAFLDAGDPPIYVGFGSISGRNPQRLTQLIIEGLQQAGVRGILATGWGGLSATSLPDTIFKIEQAPHDWLFPRMAAVVHHGGAGTTAAGLRAGRPTLICPFFGDQPFWGKRVHALGVGCAPIPQKQLTAEKLATALRELITTPSYQHNAEILGEQLRQEDGVAQAVRFIETPFSLPL